MDAASCAAMPQEAGSQQNHRSAVHTQGAASAWEVYSIASCTCIFLPALLLLLVLLLLQEVAGVESDIRELLRSHPEAAAAYKQLVTAVR